MKLSDTKMREHIEQFNQMVMNTDLSHIPIGLYHGKDDKIIHSLIFKSIRFLLRNKDKMNLIYGINVTGGAVFANKEAYINAGMLNEKFYGWGPEDFELYERLKILGQKIHRSDGLMFHLTHSRGSNSSFRSMEQNINTNKIRTTTVLSSKTELLNDLQSHQ